MNIINTVCEKMNNIKVGQEDTQWLDGLNI